MSDASESHAALVDEVASLKAKIERLESKTGIPHHVACNYPQGPMGGPGCICVVANKHEITEREAENERLKSTRSEFVTRLHNAAAEIADLKAEIERLKNACAQHTKNIRTWMRPGFNSHCTDAMMIVANRAEKSEARVKELEAALRAADATLDTECHDARIRTAIRADIAWVLKAKEE